MTIRNKIIKLSANSNFDEASILRLSELKPAGTKLILEPKTDLIELLKLTLFDLTLKKVLVIKKTLRKSHSKDPYSREYIIVERGENFEKYNPSQFEKHFTDKINKGYYFQLKPYLRLIFKEIPTVSQHKFEIIRNLKIKNLFKRDFFSIMFSIFKTNLKGNKLKKDINEYLEVVDQKIISLIENDPETALEIVLFLQGNIFLLKNLKFDLFEKLKLVSNIRSMKNSEYLDDWYWIDFMHDSDVGLSELFSDLSEVHDSIDGYFDFDSKTDWNSDYDIGDFDF